jgi:hypothetical protein
MLETLGFIAFILAIVFVMFMSPKRSDDEPNQSPKASDENKKDSDSADK